jgi:hypothetical protein
MSAWTAILSTLRLRRFTEREVRAEAYFLGTRHRGAIVDGARLELQNARLEPRRAALLRAVIRAQP